MNGIAALAPEVGSRIEGRAGPRDGADYRARMPGSFVQLLIQLFKASPGVDAYGFGQKDILACG